MHYIVFDLEFNQDFSSFKYSDQKPSRNLFEIIQIGAIKLDRSLNSIGTFNRYVQPTIYEKINPFITELTGITTEQLQKEEPFSEVFKAFVEFIDGSDFVFCTWGMSDMRELFKNIDFYKLDQSLISKMFINLQPYVSKYLGLHHKKMLRLQNAVEELDINKTYEFHNALHDAIYTSEIFKKINNSAIEPKLYNPSFVAVKPRQNKREINFDRLIQQFEKMYARTITDEEQGMIKLAYKMGKTNQFLK